MKKIKKYVLSLMAVASMAALTVSCNDNNDSETAPGTSKITVRMVDNPGDYDEVNVEVLDVMIKSNSDTGEGGWVSIGNINPGIYDLLELTGGVSVILADNEIPSGYLGQMRLILG